VRGGREGQGWEDANAWAVRGGQCKDRTRTYGL
jgi:hypothetical protein